MCYQVLKEAAVLIVNVGTASYCVFVDRNVIDHCSPMLVLVYVDK